jgi:hypothetical protein
MSKWLARRRGSGNLKIKRCVAPMIDSVIVEDGLRNVDDEMTSRNTQRETK